MPAQVAVAASSSSTAQPNKKFGTFTSLRDMSSGRDVHIGAAKTSMDRRNSVRALFGGDASASMDKPNLHQCPGNSTSNTSAKSSEGLWSISVAEASDKDSRESRKGKSSLTLYTLYVTTPTHNLTLNRSASEIVELNTKLKNNVTSSIPALPDLPRSTPQTSGRKFLQTISRTLSPVAGRSRGAFSNTNEEFNSPDGNHLQSKTLSPPPSAPLTPVADDVTQTSSHSTTVLLATYFTAIANAANIRNHKVWKRFLRVGSDDFQSVRVERRVRKVRSDLAEHVATSMAPRNVNVGEAPNQSDLDDEGGRTEDDIDSADESSRGVHVAQTRNSMTASSSVEDADSVQPNDEHRPQTNTIEMIPEETQLEAPKSARNDSEDQQRRSNRSGRKRKQDKNKVTVDDFEMIRVLGKGCAGKVLLVRHSATKGLYAMKSIHKRHVLAHQELQHTLTEQSVLKRMAREVLDPFVVRLWWSFHDSNNLYLVMDFHPGGDLATQLSRWGRLGRDRARFYAAEILEGVEGLHKVGVIYRDLKPENVLIGADGHIVLSDFGLSKEFDGYHRSVGTSTPPPTSPSRSAQVSHITSVSEDASPTSNAWLDERQTTTTFCGTAEYLAPEVLQGNPYSYEVDWWSFGTMLYEMLTGITPFWADSHADMYARVLRDPLIFPEDRVLDQDTKSILRGLLQRNPTLRMKEPRIRKHPYFSMIEWDHIFHKRYIPPYIPPMDPDNEIDTQNFDEAFLEMQPTVTHEVESNGADTADADATLEAVPTPREDVSTAQIDANARAEDMDVDDKQTVEQSHLFDGYSFRGRKDSESVKSVISTLQREGALLADTSNADTGPQKDKTGTFAESRVDTIMLDAAPSTLQKNMIDSSARDDEDDNANARAAVAALAHLEHEADMEASLSTASDTTKHADFSASQSRELSYHAASNSEESSASQMHQSPASSYSANSNKTSAPSKVAPSSSGRPSNGAIREMDDEDEDWDMVDGAGPGDDLQSEMNGGKGTNLFARGVVDTYRLLRRQDSTRLSNSTSHSSTSGRPFNRLGKRRNELSTGSMRMRSSRGTFASDSVQSLESRNGVIPTVEKTAAVHVDEATQSESKLGAGVSDNRLSGLSVSSLSPGYDGNHRTAVSPSLSGSEENKHQARMKKIKRFTTFFESSAHR